MIVLTRLNGKHIVVNAELIESVEASPDTVIALTSKTKIAVRESVNDIVRQVLDYRRLVHGLSPAEIIDYSTYAH